jgi:hypothetical protein
MYRFKTILDCINTEKQKVIHLLGEELVENTNIVDLSLLFMPGVSKSSKAYDFKELIMPFDLIDKEDFILNVSRIMDEEGLCFVVLIGKGLSKTYDSIKSSLEGYLYKSDDLFIVVNNNHIHFFIRDINHTRKIIQALSNKEIEAVIFRYYQIDYYSKGLYSRIYNPTLFSDYYCHVRTIYNKKIIRKTQI